MSQEPPPRTIAELLSIHQTSPDTYESNHHLRPMGNAQPIAFGGCTMGVAVTAAYASLPKTGPKYHAYSLQGNFLGPTLIDRPLRCRIVKLRDTRTFVTRQVIVSQKVDGSEEDRLCLNLVADFQAQEPVNAMVFSAKPTRDWGGPERAKTWKQKTRECFEAGLLNEKQIDSFEKMFKLAADFFDVRHAPGSIIGESMLGVISNVKTDQDGLDITEKVSADWIRIGDKLGEENEHVAALAAMLDMAMSFLPLVHDGKFLDAVGACSSLDFSMRLFVNGLNINEWKLREFKTIVGNEGRTFNESKLYDQNGRIVATMTQQSIMRPKPPKKQKGKI